jgi:hypothetical protein
MPYKDPEKMAEYMRERRKKLGVNVNRVNRKHTPTLKSTTETTIGLTQVNTTVNRKPVNPEQYLLSHSCKKAQYVLYQIVDGKRLMVGSRTKHSHLVFSDLDIELTWGPETEVTE